NKGATAVNYAAAYGSFRFADLLLYYRADIDRRDNEGTTPLMSAIWSGYANIADLLIQNGANLEARDKDGFTPFLIAAQNGDTLMLRYLADEGVDIYETCGDGWDALSLCIRYNHIDAVRMLIRTGDKWNDPERKSYNHYRVAARYGRQDVFNLLEKNNFPDRYREKLTQLELSLSLKASPSDIYTGMTFMFREPRVRMGWMAGFDTKLWYTRVMVQVTENLLYQYRDKSSVAYAGIFKDIQLTDNPMRGNFIFTGSLCAGYWFGDKFKGTDTSPESKLMILPAATFKWTKNNFSVLAGIEYMNTDFYKDWPVWLRAGVSYNFDFEFGKPPVKLIKWY
ncbi:MAG: ankyrin repeat domain-containing protein, partial [Bacteroidales bacterium]|nr:ankyrin repeat domain-containing protein [Bacteroidales bacterium]